MTKRKLSSLAAAVTLTIAPGIGSASVYGFLGNFDVINDTGLTAHGVEIELEGLHIEASEEEAWFSADEALPPTVLQWQSTGAPASRKYG